MEWSVGESRETLGGRSLNEEKRLESPSLDELA